MLGEATTAEANAVQAWLESSDANQQLYAGMVWLWKQSLQLADTSDVDEEQAWQRFHERVAEKAPVIPLYKRTAFRVAAAIVILFAAAFVGLRLLSGDGRVENLAFVANDSAIARALPDGSVVTLNRSSVLYYPSAFKENYRNVRLEGEAFFNVQPDKKKPFMIQVNDVNIRVVGTSFNVKSINGETEVIVETGIVQVTRNGKTVELRAAEKINTGADSTLAPKQVTDRLYNYYRTREFECDGTPLWKLVEVLNEAYDANIVIGREALRSEQISTTFNNEPLEKVLEVVGATLGLKVENRGDSILLK